MSYRLEKNGEDTDLVFEGFDKGVAPSPHKGVANIKNANISTEEGEALCSFNRIADFSLLGGTGTLTPTSQSTVSYSGVTVPVGTWFTITADSGTGLSGSYYVVDTNKISRTLAFDTSTEVTTIKTTAQTTVFLTAGTTWNVPSDWSSTLNTVECIGGGGGGGSSVVAGGTAGSGGGGAAYSKQTNVTLTPGGTATYQVGTAGTGGVAGAGVTGGDTFFNGASLGASSVGAKGGVGGGGNSNTTTGGAGGASASGVGSTKFSGGKGGDNGTQSNGSGTGGGAAGPSGAGGAGATGGGAGVGGTADNGTVAGGASSANGNSGTEFDGTHGCGSGAGESSNSQVGFTGGNYGGGGGGGGGISNHNGGAGGAGLIVITYYSTTAPVTTSASISIVGFGNPIQRATEKYLNSSGVTQYRYYVLDSAGGVWIHDSDSSAWSGVTVPKWFLTEATPTLNGRVPGGLAVINGWLSISLGPIIYWKPTFALNSAFLSVSTTSSNLSTNTQHPTLVGHQGRAYYGDGVYVASMFPDSVLATTETIPNVQSCCSWVSGVAGLFIVATVRNGSFPLAYDANGDSLRVPVVFFSSGTLPSSLSALTVYHLHAFDATEYQVFANPTGGSAITDFTTGATGNQFFNTFSPRVATTYLFTQQALNLPAFESAQCMAELGNTVLVGGITNTIYPWNQVSVTPDDIIPLPENNVANLITVNNLAYAFVGQKGNIYVTNGSSVSLVTKIPDYCAGIPGTPASYIEPYFSWGDAMFLRGKIWFSALDQTATKTGQCGGIWSFIPTNNFYIGQDVGIALHLENKSSYGTYNGLSALLIPNQNQNAIGPQYYSAWYSSITSPTYGIDTSDTVPVTSAVIETDLVPTGTMLEKATFEQIEYKLAAPLASGETVSVAYRQNATDAFTSAGTATTESATGLSGFIPASFQKGQWLQLQATLNSLGSASSSFIRFKELRIR